MDHRGVFLCMAWFRVFGSLLSLWSLFLDYCDLESYKAPKQPLTRALASCILQLASHGSSKTVLLHYGDSIANLAKYVLHVMLSNHPPPPPPERGHASLRFSILVCQHATLSSWEKLRDKVVPMYTPGQYCNNKDQCSFILIFVKTPL